jgi:hypothetical protein
VQKIAQRILLLLSSFSYFLFLKSNSETKN